MLNAQSHLPAPWDTCSTLPDSDRARNRGWQMQLRPSPVLPNIERPPSSLNHVPSPPPPQPHCQVEAFSHLTEQTWFGESIQSHDYLAACRDRHCSIGPLPSSSPRHERRHTHGGIHSTYPQVSLSSRPQTPGAAPGFNLPMCLENQGDVNSLVHHATADDARELSYVRIQRKGGVQFDG